MVVRTSANSLEQTKKMWRVVANTTLACLALACGVFARPLTALAYEQSTHALLTLQSVSGSALSLSTSATLQLLSFPSSVGLSVQCPLATSLEVAACIAAQGAYDEDNLPRMANHFFDYQNNGGPFSDFLLASLVPCTPFTPSSSWILTGQGQAGCADHPYGTVYAYDTSSSGATVVNGSPVVGVKQAYLAALTSPTVAARQQQTQQLFLSLGHVLHHLQDMAQPQHTRNEDHCNPGNIGGLAGCPFIGLAYAPSFYEAYVADPRNNAASLISSVAAHPTLPSIAGSMVFNLPADFWNSAYGMPAFSSTNFFSAGTNLQLTGAGGATGTAPASEPLPSFGQLSVASSQAAPPSSVGQTTYYQVQIHDALSGTTTSHLATAYTFFTTTFRGNQVAHSSFKLTPEIYQDQMQTLIPKGITYSQWFVDYLFRGSISGSLDSSGNLTITNKSATDTLNIPSDGVFTLYADDANGVRSFVWDSIEGNCNTANIAPGQSVSCDVGGALGSPPPSGSYLLVYSGALEQESNQVAVTKVTLTKAQAYVINIGTNSVSVIDTGVDGVVATIPVGSFPEGIAALHDGSKVYIANNASNSVSVIDTSSNTVATTILLGAGVRPTNIAISPDSKTAYVATQSSEICVVDTASDTVVALLGITSDVSGNLALSADGARIYMSGNLVATSTTNQPAVVVLSAATGARLAAISLGSVGGAAWIALNPQGTKAFAAIDGINGDFISVIDTSTNTIAANVPDGTLPRVVTITPDGSRVYVTNGESNTVAVIDATTNARLGTISVGSAPEGVAITPDGTKVYVTNESSLTVSVIDTSTNTVLKSIPMAAGPYLIAIPGGR